jgi:hypothetical protein
LIQLALAAFWCSSIKPPLVSDASGGFSFWPPQLAARLMEEGGLKIDDLIQINKTPPQIAKIVTVK